MTTDTATVTCEYQLSLNGRHTAPKQVALAVNTLAIHDGTRQVWSGADVSPWGDVTLLVGISQRDALTALRLGLSEMARQAEMERAYAAWQASLPKPAFVEKLIREEDWPTLYRLQDAGKLSQEQAAQLPSRETSPAVDVALKPPPASVTYNATDLLAGATMVSSSPWAASVTSATLPYPEEPSTLKRPATSRAPRATAAKSSKTTKATKAGAKTTKAATRGKATKRASATSGAATASGRSKRSSAASASRSSSRTSSRVKSTPA